MSELALSRQIAEIARALQAENGSHDTVELAVRLAVEVIEGAEDAAISVVRAGGEVETLAATSERASKAGSLQQELAAGPLVAEVWEHEVVGAAALGQETRWGAWSSRACNELGLGSVLCFRMLGSARRVGALSVYASSEHAFNSADIEAGMSFAAHAAIAIEVARRDENLEIALDSRSVIGQATGLLMERYGIDAVRAFAVLKRTSSVRNVKLHRIASELIQTRVFP